MQLKNTQIIESLNIYQCHYCHISFISKDMLEKHTKYYHEFQESTITDGPKSEYRYLLFFLMFETYSQFAVIAQKLYKCTKCEFEATLNGTFQNHQITVHSG